MQCRHIAVQLYKDMDVVIDTSAVVAVIMGEPERQRLVRLTAGLRLIAPQSLHWEVGNALTAMFKRGRIAMAEAAQALDLYQEIEIRFVAVDLKEALELAQRYDSYAYDAYMLACALRHNSPLLSLDTRLIETARQAGVSVLETSR